MSTFTPALVRAAVALALATVAPVAAAQEVYWHAPLESLELVELDDEVTRTDHGPRRARGAPARALLDGPGEAWLASPAGALLPFQDGQLARVRVCVRTPAARGTVTGRVYAPRPDGTGFRGWRFELDPRHVDDEARGHFWRAQAEHYERLLRTDLAGAAWFRHRAREARRELGDESDPAGTPARPPRRHDLDDAYDLFTGGRAVSENLQLDRVWESAAEGERDVDVAALPGIDVEEFDWKARVEGLDPARDPLAAWIPADQHAVFFPGFAGLVRVVDETARLGTPILRGIDPRAEDARTRERYERQLCLELDAVARVLGPAVVRSVALTGSDPYLRTGSDVALLFDCSQPAAFLAAVTERQRRAAEQAPDAETPAEAELAAAAGAPREGDAWSAVRTPDRRLCSYALRRGDVVVVGNSLPQIARVLAASAGDVAALDASPEYVFFRDRYARGADDEAAFVLLTDATIRRWCGPRWRIGAARRTRAGAVLAQHQAEAVPELLTAGTTGAPSATLVAAAHSGGLGELAVTPRGARSSVYNTLDFQTPILELDLDRATEEERDAYLRFRNRYQSRWRDFFDPIALHLSVADDRLGLDVTVMPLIGSTDYAEFADLSGDATIDPGDGDPHPEALLHWALAVSRSSRTLRKGRDVAGSVVPGLDDPLSWLGDTVAAYADADPFWGELAQAEEIGEFLQRNLSRLPVALHVEVANPLGLASLLTSLRAFSDQAAPGMTVWENREHAGRKYVRITPSEDFATDDFPDLALHYVVLPSGATFSTRADMIHRAIDRHAARAAEDAPAPAPWPGESVAVRVRAEAFDELFPLWLADTYDDHLRARSWSHLDALNEWHRLFPDRDPVEVHERLWGARLVCPGGGEYVWDEALQTMESTAYGHPLEPREGPGPDATLRELLTGDAGLTFEDQGLRARVSLRRAP